MRITEVAGNNRRRVFEVRVRSREFVYPYSAADPPPSSEDRLREVRVDREIGGEGFSYVLESGVEGTVHIEQVLEYNRDPGYLADNLLYNLTLEAQKRIQASPLSTREIIRRLGTSPAQYYRLLDRKNYRKSIKQLVALLAVLDCEVDLVVRDRRSA